MYSTTNKKSLYIFLLVNHAPIHEFLCQAEQTLFFTSERKQELIGEQEATNYVPFSPFVASSRLPISKKFVQTE